jgi:hypothetical protein
MNIKLFEYLLSLPENDIIDFKEVCHQFNGKKEDDDGKFIKDILSFGNSIRTETAYIISGVKFVGANKSLVGTIPMMDDASLQQKVETKVFPKPKFTSYMFPYQGMEFGIIEIPVQTYERPLTATIVLKGCKPGTIYIRRGSSNAEADGIESIAVNDWFKSLTFEEQNTPEKKIYDGPENYIARTVSPVDSDPIGMYFRDGKPLQEIIKTHRKVALLGWGLSGKSTELANLAYELSSLYQVFPFLVPLGNHVDEPIEDRIPSVKNIPQDQMVVLLDGLDEVLPDKFEAARRKISQFVSDYPNATVVVSCRTNFYTTSTDEFGDSTLVKFDSYRLDGLKDEQINAYVERTDPKNSREFFKEIAKRQVGDLLATPYYLVKLVLQYKDTQRISDSKAALFDAEIRQLIKKEVAKTQSSGRGIFEKYLLKLFKRLAFIMEAKGTNEITTEELSEIFPIMGDYEKVINAGAIFYISNPAKDLYKFNHNNTQEYLAAQELADQSLRKIKSVIGIGPDFKRVKPSWVNTLSFLNSILCQKCPLKKKITNWLVKYNRDLVIVLEPEKIAPEVRYQAFKSIFEEYKQKGRRINRNIYRPENLAKFSESPKVFRYILRELKSTKDPVIIANAIEIINFYPLQQYPEFQAKFKSWYEKFLFGAEDSLYYLALPGYAANFKLTSEEFKAVYLKFKDNDDTWIRYQLFQAIWLTGNQEVLISYVLEQAKILIKEDRRMSHERQNKNRLSNEYSEIAKCLQEIKTAKALITLFTELENEFVSFAHSTYFGKALNKLLLNAAEFPKNAALTKQVIKIFRINHSYILHDPKLNKAFIGYFEKTGQVEKTLTALYGTGLSDFSLGHSVAQLATPQFIDFLRQEFDVGKITPDAMNTMERFIQTTENPNEEYFRQVFELPANAALPIRDYKQEMAETMARNLAALFDKNIYLQEVEKIFTLLNKTTITYNDTYSYAEPDYWSGEFCDVARDALQLGPHNGDAVWAELKVNIDLCFDSRSIYNIYNYLLRHNDAVLTEPQIGLLTEWCDQMAVKVNFKEAINQHDADSWDMDRDAVMFSYFLRKLKLDKYPETLYRDMVSFIKYDDQLIEIIPFVEEVIGYEKTKEQVLANIDGKIANSRSFGDHLNFIEEHEVKESLKSLIPYLYGPQDSNHHQVLKIYLALGGKISKLKPVLNQSDSYFQHTLIDEFVRVRHPYIEKYLKKKFREEHDEKKKLSLSRYLIRMQNEEALDFYINFMVEHGDVPDDSSPHNPLYWLKKPKFIEKVLGLYELSQDKKYYRDSFKDLRSISANAIRNIALEGYNFPKVRKRIKSWIDKRKRNERSGETKLPGNLISDLYFYLESYDKEFYNRVQMLNLKKAISLYRSIYETRKV